MAAKKASKIPQAPDPNLGSREKSGQNSIASNITLTAEQIQEYKEAFKEFDKNGDGTISTDEFAVVVRSFGYGLSEDHIRQLVADGDLDGNGVIDFDEFVHLMQNVVRPMNSEELIYEAFQNIGVDGSGTITQDALREKAKELGLEFTDDELDDMIEEAAPDDNGKVSYQGLIQFMSDGNETIMDAFKRRQVIEQKQKEIEEQRTQENEEKEDDETTERVPDIEEIASQFDRSTYDEFSRQSNGRRVIKKPGKKVPLSKTRMQYLKRKAEAQGLDVDEYIEAKEIKDAEHRAMRRTSSSKDIWMGSIHDDKTYDTKFRSNPPKAYRHVESKLHVPSPRQMKQPIGTSRDKNNDKTQKAVLQTSVVTDFDKELKKIQKSRETKHSTKFSSNMFPMQSNYKRLIPNVEKVDFKSLDGYLARKKQMDVYNINFNMWRTFFEKAVKQIKEAKHKIDTMETVLKEVQYEQKHTKVDSNYTTAFTMKKKERQNFRPKVITPTLDNRNQVKVEVKKTNTERKLKQSSSVSSGLDLAKTKPEHHVNQKKNTGSYTNKFLEARGMAVPDTSEDYFSVGTQNTKKTWKPPKRNYRVISKDSLDLYV